MMELASLFNQFLCHATSGQVPTSIFPTSINGNSDNKVTANQLIAIVTALVTLPPTQNQQLLQQMIP